MLKFAYAAKFAKRVCANDNFCTCGEFAKRIGCGLGGGSGPGGLAGCARGQKASETEHSGAHVARVWAPDLFLQMSKLTHV